MIMTAKEAMQALLVGETLKRDDPWCLIKLDDKGNLVKCDTKYPLEKNEFKDFCTLIGTMNGTYEEYPLDFEQALREMLDGRTVMCESIDEHAYRFRNGMFEGSTKWGRFTDWESCTIFTGEQRAKWRVVECL